MDLMRFQTAKRRDPAVEAWLAARSGELAPLARHWFERMRDCGPDMRELLHDGFPVACVHDIALERLIEDAYEDIRRRLSDPAPLRR